MSGDATLTADLEATVASDITPDRLAAFNSRTRACPGCGRATGAHTVDEIKACRRAVRKAEWRAAKKATGTK